MPDRGSEQAKLTVTFVLFQPFAFGAGFRVAVIDGASLSSLMLIDPFPTLPTRSVAVEVLLALGVETVWLSAAGVGPLATPDPASTADQVIETSPLNQAAALAVGETAAVTVGPVLSTVYERVTLDDPFEHAASSNAVIVVVLEPSGPGAATRASVHVLVPLTDVGVVALAE